MTLNVLVRTAVGFSAKRIRLNRLDYISARVGNPLALGNRILVDKVVSPGLNCDELFSAVSVSTQPGAVLTDLRYPFSAPRREPYVQRPLARLTTFLARSIA